MPPKDDKDPLADAKKRLDEDLKTIMKVVTFLLYSSHLTSSKRARAWNVVQAMGNIFNEMIRTDKPFEFLAGSRRLQAAYGGIVDILGIDKKPNPKGS